MVVAGHECRTLIQMLIYWCPYPVPFLLLKVGAFGSTFSSSSCSFPLCSVVMSSQSRSCHTHLVDTRTAKLHVSDIKKPLAHSYSLVTSSGQYSSSHLYQKAAIIQCDVQNLSSPWLACTCRCFWVSCPTVCYSASSLVWHDTCLQFEQWRQDWMLASVVSSVPTIGQPGFDLHRHLWSLLSSFLTGKGHSGMLSGWPPQVGSGHIRPVRLWSATDCEPHCRLVSSDRVWRQPTIFARRWRWCSLLAREHGDYSIHKMDIPVQSAVPSTPASPGPYLLVIYWCLCFYNSA